MTSSIDPEKIKSILIIRLSAIGDVIHALPVLSELRNHFPEAKIGWIVEELSAPLLEHHPMLDQLYVIPKKRWKKNLRKSFLSEMRPFFKGVSHDGWDVALDLQGLTKSGLATWFSGAKIRIGYGDNDGREINKLFTNCKAVPDSSLEHVVARNLELLRPLGIEPDHTTPGILGILDDEKKSMGEKLRECGWDGASSLAALNPGAGWSSKRWQPEYFAETGKLIFEKSGFHPLILWGPGEEPVRDSIADILDSDSVPFVKAPMTTVRELAVLISLTDFFVGGDTGPTHIAGLLGIPTVSIFGASDGQRNRPWPVHSSEMIQLDELDCVPCWDTVCGLKGDENLKCLKLLKPDLVLDRIDEKFPDLGKNKNTETN